MTLPPRDRFRDHTDMVSLIQDHLGGPQVDRELAHRVVSKLVTDGRIVNVAGSDGFVLKAGVDVRAVALALDPPPDDAFFGCEQAMKPYSLSLDSLYAAMRAAGLRIGDATSHHEVFERVAVTVPDAARTLAIQAFDEWDIVGSGPERLHDSTFNTERPRWCSNARSRPEVQHQP